MPLARGQPPRRLGEDRPRCQVRELCPLSVASFAQIACSSYIYRIFMGADGNHSLHKKSKRDDKTDYSLAGGRAFFADAEKMSEFAKKTSKDRTVVSSILICG